MFGEERKVNILEYVQAQGRVTVSEISAKYGVSESTVRRDLQELEEAGLLRRAHGGAVSLQVVNHEPTYGEKTDRFRREKLAIAKKAAERIEEGDAILLDSGTTTLQMVAELKKFSRLTVVTNSLQVPMELQHLPGIDVMLTGGTLRKETLAFVGPIAERSLDLVRVDKAFVAANGICVKEGLTTPNLIEAATKRKMIEVAQQVILLADHTKFGKVSLAKFADMAEVDLVITDHGVSETVISEFRAAGIELLAERV